MFAVTVIPSSMFVHSCFVVNAGRKLENRRVRNGTVHGRYAHTSGPSKLQFSNSLPRLSNQRMLINVIWVFFEHFNYTYCRIYEERKKKKEKKGRRNQLSSINVGQVIDFARAAYHGITG